jgi:hypothetical protein
MDAVLGAGQQLLERAHQAGQFDALLRVIERAPPGWTLGIDRL